LNVFKSFFETEVKDFNFLFNLYRKKKSDKILTII